MYMKYTSYRQQNMHNKNDQTMDCDSGARAEDRSVLACRLCLRQEWKDVLPQWVHTRVNNGVLFRPLGRSGPSRAFTAHLASEASRSPTSARAKAIAASEGEAREATPAAGRMRHRPARAARARAVTAAGGPGASGIRGGDEANLAERDDGARSESNLSSLSRTEIDTIDTYKNGPDTVNPPRTSPAIEREFVRLTAAEPHMHRDDANVLRDALLQSVMETGLHGVAPPATVATPSFSSVTPNTGASSSPGMSDGAGPRDAELSAVAASVASATAANETNQLAPGVASPASGSVPPNTATAPGVSAATPSLKRPISQAPATDRSPPRKGASVSDHGIRGENLAAALEGERERHRLAANEWESKKGKLEGDIKLRDGTISILQGEASVLRANLIQTAQFLEGTKLNAEQCVKLNKDLNCTIADLKRTIQERDSTIAQLDKNVASLKKCSGDQASEITELEEFRVLHASAKRASEREAKQIVRRSLFHHPSHHSLSQLRVSSQAAGYTHTTAAWAEDLADSGSRRDSVYTQKSKMLKRMREQLILRSFGNRTNRDELLVALVRDSSIDDETLVEMLSKELRQRIEINEYGMSQLEKRLQILKRCRSEDERRNFHRVLTAVAPEPSKFGEQSGKTTQLCRRLRIRRNSKPYLASKQRAAEVDAAEAEHAKPLVAGALVVCRYGSGTLTKLNPDGSCTVQLAHGEVNFASTGEAKGTAKAKGSGRIRRQPISFSPPSRAPGSNRTPDDVIHDIENYLETHCPTSPNHRDSIRHRHGPCQYETQAENVSLRDLERAVARLPGRVPSICEKD